MLDDPKRIDQAGLALFLLVAVTLSTLVFTQGFRPLRAAEVRTQAFERAISILADTEGSVASLETEIRDVRHALDVTQAALPDALAMDGVLDRIGRMAERFGVHVARLTPGIPTERTLYTELRLELRVMGPFLDIYRFVRTLERTEGLARVELLRATAGASADAVSADIRIVFYYMQPDRG